MANRSVERAEWDETALTLELQEIQEMDFDLSLTGFDTHEIDVFLAFDDEEKAKPLVENSAFEIRIASRPHNDATPAGIAALRGCSVSRNAVRFPFGSSDRLRRNTH